MCRGLFYLSGVDCVATGRDFDALKGRDFVVAVSHPFGLLEEGYWQTRRFGEERLCNVECNWFHSWGHLGGAVYGKYICHQSFSRGAIVTQQPLVQKCCTVLYIEVTECMCASQEM